MIVKQDIVDCKKDLEAFLGRTVKLISNGGRKRTIVYEGVLDCCYPNVFTVRRIGQKTDSYEEMISYSYIDVLTKAVEISEAPEN